MATGINSASAMLGPNPFLRRASSPGETQSSKAVPQLAIPQQPSPSLSEQSRRPMTLRATHAARTRTIRPARFIKAAAAPSSLDGVEEEMVPFIQLFDTFHQKVYVEGYLLQHVEDGGAPQKCFAELCGSTLTWWDAGVAQGNVQPRYVNVADASVRDAGNRAFTIDLPKKSITFEVPDTMVQARWVCAIRLAGFELQKLHQLFTLRLLPCIVPASLGGAAAASPSHRCGSYLQVRLPHTTEWHKLWAVAQSDKRDERRLFGGSKKSSAAIASLALYETKKSKTALWTLTDIMHAYAVYPESPQLIRSSTILRVQGRWVSSRTAHPHDNHDAHPHDACDSLLLMADTTEHMARWLLALFDAFKLYGRPQTLTHDRHNPAALNFGEPTEGSQRLYLEAEDVIPDLPTSINDSRQIEKTFVDALQRMQRQTRANGRANSLPLITVACEDSETETKPIRQRSTSHDLDHLSGGYASNDTDKDTCRSGGDDVGEDDADAPEDGPEDYEDGAHGFKFARHVADSSDSSDEDDEEDYDEEEEEADSDDEPIGKNKNVSRAASPVPPASKPAADSLIPDFDFGNGFDVGARRESASSAHLLDSQLLHPSCATTTSTTSSSSTSSIGGGGGGGGADDTAHTLQKQVKQSASSSQAQQPLSCETTMFGDFSLSTDFTKYLDQPLSASDRKYSLPANVRLSERRSVDMLSSPSPSGSFPSHASSAFERRSSSWDHRDDFEWEQQPQSSHGSHGRSQRHLYDDDSYDSDGDGPLIPSLGDNFAPQNSLLDNYLGEQLSAKEQIEYARATGQPLIQVPAKPRAPQQGLVGMITQRERDRREGHGLRVTERVHQHHADRFEREKERRIIEQRQQQFMKHQIMLYANGYPTMPMMNPYMGVPMMGAPPSPQLASPITPATPTSPMSPMMAYGGRPYSPSGMRSPSMSSPISHSRRTSRQLLADEDDDQHYSSSMGRYTRRSPPPASSSSTGSGSVRL